MTRNLLNFFVKITQGKINVTQGKHSEFHLGWNVTALYSDKNFIVQIWLQIQ